MKKNICFVFILISFQNLNAQSACEKGTWIFGISPLKYTFVQKQFHNIYTADTLSNSDTLAVKGFSAGFNIGACYFVADNFCVGAGLGLTEGGSGTNSFLYLPTQLFARYYLLQKKHCYSFKKENLLMSRSALFLQGVISGGYSNMDFKTRSNTSNNEVSQYGAYLALGYTYLLTEHVAIEAQVNSFYSVTNNIYTSNSFQQKNVSKSVGSYVSLGIQTYF